MGLLDRGTETVTLFPSEDAVDAYGTPTRRPVAVGVEVRGVYMLALGGSEDSSDGQSARPRFRLIGRLPEVPGFDAFGEVEWRGRRFDVLDVPVRREVPARLAHTVVLLQER